MHGQALTHTATSSTEREDTHAPLVVSKRLCLEPDISPRDVLSSLATEVMPLGGIRLQFAYFLCEHVFGRGTWLLPAHTDQFWVCILRLTYAF